MIDNFSALIKGHHRDFKDFSVVGHTLEASSKIYGLRVDSVHTDVVQMASGLTNMNDQNVDGNASNEGDGGGGNNDDGNESTAAVAPVKKTTKRPRKTIHTVTKNKDTINQKLDTHCMSEATFAKLNSVVGDINSSHRLMNYILPTKESELLHLSSTPFWDVKDHVVENAADLMTADEVDDGRGTDLWMDKIDVSQTVNLNFNSLDFPRQLLVRPNMSGYRITDTPIDEES